MREFINVGMTVRAPEVSMGTVYIQVLSYIQESKLSLFVMIAEPAIFVTEQAVLFVISKRRRTTIKKHCCNHKQYGVDYDG